MARRSINLGAVTGTGAGTAFDVPNNNLSGLSVYFFGTFSATVAIEVSCDGSVFVPLKDLSGAAVSVTGATGTMFNLSGSATHIRRNCSAFTSGSVGVVLCG